MDRIALKQLTQSDLSLFAPHLRRSKQKGINLNAEVFIDLFYPGLRGRFDPCIFPLTIVGPGNRKPHGLTRKVLRSTAAKNWRLDGEIINSPEEESDRYDRLVVGDFALLGFDGADQPRTVTMVLVSSVEDAALHASVQEMVQVESRHTMKTLSQDEVAGLLSATASFYPTTTHPLLALLSPDGLEEALFGAPEVRRLSAVGDGRGAQISQEAFRAQLEAAEEIGDKGEAAFARWLEQTGHSEDDYEWVSRTHARASFDFAVTPQWAAPHPLLHVDVKATRGRASLPIYMSMAEIRWAAAHSTYRIARIFDLDAETPHLFIYAGVDSVAQQIVTALDSALPAGIDVVSIQLDVACLLEEFSSDIPSL